MANRDLAARPIGRSAGWSTVKQVHGGDVVAAHAMGRHRPADAQWTDEPSPTLAVFAADCVLVLLVGPQRVGVAHAGWRGIVAGVVENAIDAVQPSAVFAGPAIGPCCFEVGAEVVDAFSQNYAGAIADDRHIDLWLAVEAAARGGGVERVHTSRLCTSCHADLFFSHRRDRGLTGRQALVATLATDEGGDG
jgi:YfiH family protein